jgi:hypothetical protein
LAVLESEGWKREGWWKVEVKVGRWKRWWLESGGWWWLVGWRVGRLVGLKKWWVVVGGGGSGVAVFEVVAV